MPQLSKPRVILAFNFLVALLVFLLPSHFFLKGDISTAYVRGLLIDYLIPKLYASDLVILAIIAIGLYLIRPKLARNLTKLQLLFGGLTLALLLSQLASLYWLSASIMGVRMVLMLGLGWILVKLKSQLQASWILGALLATVIFQSSLGLYQFITQQSLAGYWLLGEPGIPAASGLAAASFVGQLRFLPYGTTAHPNVLAGVLAVFLVSLIGYWSRVKKLSTTWQTSWFLAIGMGGLTLLLTHSISAWLSFLLGGAILLFYKKQFLKPLLVGAVVVMILIPVTLTLTAQNLSSNSSITRRNHLNQNALTLWQQHPLTGVGLTTNAAAGEPLTAIQEPVRFAQPTHHLGLLWLSETGLLGLAWVICLAFIIRKQLTQTPPLWLMLIPIAALDHYLLTTQAGLLLMTLLVAGTLTTQKLKE